MAVRRLSPQEAGKVLAEYVLSGWLIVGVGSELRCDDGFGPYLARIVRAVAESFGLDANVVDAGNAPELYTDVMRRYGDVLILDAVEVPGNYPPGTVILAEVGADEKQPLLISTHSMNLPVIMRVCSLDKVVVLGTVPQCLNYEIGLSREVARNLREITKSYIEYLRKRMYK